MTRKEFEKYRIQIESDRLHHADIDPLSFGMQRASFEKGKLTKLIAAAETVEGKTARAYAERWKRKLKKISSSQNNFQKLRSDLRKSKFDIFSGLRAARLERESGIVRSGKGEARAAA